MSTRTGFPRMDWDTGFLADPKFQHLRDLLPDPIRFGYAGFCYLRLAADAWRTCQRHPIGDVVRGIEEWAAGVLQESGLLDGAYCVTEESFDKWVGAALEARAVWKDKKKRHRESPSVPESPVESPSVTRTPEPVRNGRESRNGRNPQVGTDEGVQGEAPVFAFLAEHKAYVRPDSPLGVRLVQLIERRGSDAVLAVAETLAEKSPVLSDRQWVLGLENEIERVPAPVSKAEVRAADVAEEGNVRSERIQAEMYARRVERFRFTGEWDESLGPKPEPSADVA